MWLGLNRIQHIKTISEVREELEQKINITNSIRSVIELSINTYKAQFRKSGEPYIIQQNDLLLNSVLSFSKIIIASIDYNRVLVNTYILIL